MKTNDPANDIRVGSRQIGYEEIDYRRPSDVRTSVLWVNIPYTTPELTRVALRHVAARGDLNVHVSLVDIQVVPFPCPLDQPPINGEFSEHRLRELFKEAGLPGRTAVLYTRDWLEGFLSVLEPRSLVVMAIHKRRWRTRETKRARALSKAGHQVMLLPTGR